MNCEVTKKDYIRLVKKLYGAKVALIGGHADSIDYGKLEAYRLIVCTNDHIIDGCNGLYTGLPHFESLKVIPKLRLLVSTHPNHTALTPQVMSLTSSHCVTIKADSRWTLKQQHQPTQEVFSSFIRTIQSKPYTGILAMHHLLSFPIAELFMTGFTFYHDSESFPEHVNGHSNLRQLLYLKDLLCADFRLKIDKTLQGLL